MGLDNTVLETDVLYKNCVCENNEEDCEDGKKPIEIAASSVSHAMIGHLLCRIAINSVFNESLPYLVDHFKTHEGGFSIGVYLGISLPEIDGIEGLTMQVNPPNCDINIFQ